MPRGAAVAAVAVALALAGPAAADECRIAPTWEQGIAEATRRNVPLLVVFQKDGAAGFSSQLGSQAAFLNDRVIVIVGHRPGGHQPAKRMERGPDRQRREVEYCPTYPSITCAAHDAVYNDHGGGYDYTDCPAAFLCRPNGRLIEGGIEKCAAQVLQQKVNAAQVTLGEAVFQSEIDRLEGKLGKGDEKRDQGKLTGARKAYEDALEDCRKPLLRTICEERLVLLDQKAMEMIEAARSMSAGERHETLKQIEREMRGRAPSERATAVLAELEGGTPPAPTPPTPPAPPAPAPPGG